MHALAAPLYRCYYYYYYYCRCGLVARDPGCRFRGPRFDSGRYHIFWEVMGLERGSLSPFEDN
jgi:hypothetical protein